MKKYTILAAMLFGLFGSVLAQEGSSQSNGGGSAAGFAPEAGDISVAVLFGRGNFLSSGLEMTPSAYNRANYWTVPGTAPSADMISTNDNSVTNIVGAEIRYFLQPNIALKLSGGAIHRNTPARVNVPGGMNDGSDNSSWIPAYEAVVSDNRLNANVNLGVEYHYNTKYNRLFPYTGLTVPFYYGRRTMYDPTITGGENPVIVDVGARHTEAIGFGAQVVGGVDYYLMEGLYFGFEIKPVSYIYAYNTKFPAPGLETLQADNHTISFFSQTFLKLGFRF
jgi:hypothetical protein